MSFETSKHQKFRYDENIIFWWKNKKKILKKIWTIYKFKFFFEIFMILFVKNKKNNLKKTWITYKSKYFFDASLIDFSNFSNFSNSIWFSINSKSFASQIQLNSIRLKSKFLQLIWIRYSNFDFNQSNRWFVATMQSKFNIIIWKKSFQSIENIKKTRFFQHKRNFSKHTN